MGKDGSAVTKPAATAGDNEGCCGSEASINTWQRQQTGDDSDGSSQPAKRHGGVEAATVGIAGANHPIGNNDDGCGDPQTANGRHRKSIAALAANSSQRSTVCDAPSKGSTEQRLRERRACKTLAMETTATCMGKTNPNVRVENDGMESHEKTSQT